MSGIHYPGIALLTAGLVAGFLFAEGRLFYLQILRHKDLGAMAEKAERFSRHQQPLRGEIRAGLVTMAVSVPTKNVYADLSVCSNRLEACARIIGESLHLNSREVLTEFRSHLSTGARRESKAAICVKRQVTEADWQALTNALARSFFSMNSNRLSRAEKGLLKKLRASAVFSEEDQMRIYPPAAASLGPLLGFTRLNTNGCGLHGVAGLERAFNPLLSGALGIWRSKKNARGHELAFLRELRVPPIDGNHLILTIDPQLQETSARVLSAACARYAPSNATVLIVKPKTGEILSWVSWPFQNPNQPPVPGLEFYRNHAIGDCQEPGSPFKMFTMAAALNENLATLDQRFDGEQGRFRYREAVLHDTRPHGILTLREATAKSVNVVFAKLGIALGPARFSRYIVDFGFGRPTGIPLPAEAPGKIKTDPNWPAFVETRIPIGQGLGVTQLQMAMAACAIANQGCLLRPLLISRIVNPQGQEIYRGQPSPVRLVITPKTAQLVLEALTEVTSAHGTGKAAMLDSITVAGKTGTAEMANEKGYLRGCYYASFIGFLPAKDPQICILIGFTCPKNGHAGGALAAPVFKEIAEKAAPYLGIPPDKFGPGIRPAPRQNAPAAPLQLALAP